MPPKRTKVKPRRKDDLDEMTKGQLQSLDRQLRTAENHASKAAKVLAGLRENVRKVYNDKMKEQ